MKREILAQLKAPKLEEFRMDFPIWEPQNRGKRSAAWPQTIDSEFPQK